MSYGSAREKGKVFNYCTWLSQVDWLKVEVNYVEIHKLWWFLIIQSPHLSSCFPLLLVHTKDMFDGLPWNNEIFFFSIAIFLQFIDFWHVSFKTHQNCKCQQIPHNDKSWITYICLLSFICFSDSKFVWIFLAFGHFFDSFMIIFTTFFFFNNVFLITFFILWFFLENFAVWLYLPLLYNGASNSPQNVPGTFIYFWSLQMIWSNWMGLYNSI